MNNNLSNDNDLLPCPFCGSKAEISEGNVVRCYDPACGTWQPTRRLWNARPPQKPDWTVASQDAPHDGPYLCQLSVLQECGNVWMVHRVINNSMNKWALEKGETLVAWQKIEPYTGDQTADEEN